MKREEAWQTGTTEIFNTDLGCQFTSDAFTNILLANSIQISMEGKGRAMDDRYPFGKTMESVKYEVFTCSGLNPVRIYTRG